MLLHVQPDSRPALPPYLGVPACSGRARTARHPLLRRRLTVRPSRRQWRVPGLPGQWVPRVPWQRQCPAGRSGPRQGRGWRRQRRRPRRRREP